MKLPSKTALRGKIHKELYHIDTLELHSQINTHTSLKYKERIGLLSRLTTSTYRNGPVLDVGCAQGNLAILLSEIGLDVVAVDLRFEALTYAKMKQDENRVHFVCASGDFLPFRSQVFEGVILGEILEHVAFPEDFLREARRILLSEGFLIISTPNAECLVHGLPTFSRCDRTKLSEFGQGPKGHLFFFTVEELHWLLKQLRFRVWYTSYINPLLVNKHLEPLLRLIPIHIVTALSRRFAGVPILDRKMFRIIVTAASHS